MFDWNDLKYLLTVARSGSTLAAAKTLGINQSTVHRRLQELEKRLGREIVRRHPSGYRLTELGREILPYVEQIETAILSIERRLDARDDSLSGQIKITCPEVIGVRLLNSELMHRFRERYPNLRIEFMLSDKLLDLSKGEADIAIRATAPYDAGLFGRKIAQTPWAIYASHDYVAKHGGLPALEDLERHSIAVLDSDHEENKTKTWFGSVAPGAKVAARCNSMTALRAAARSGVGLVSLPVTIGDSDPDLCRVFGPIEGLSTDFYLLIHEEMKSSKRVRALFDFIIDEIGIVRPILSGQDTTARSSGG